MTQNELDRRSKRLAASIKAVRIAAGMSQRQLGEAIGVTKMTIWRWESLNYDPLTMSVRRLVRLADVTGCESLVSGLGL